MHVAIILKFGFFKGRLIILLYFVNLADGRWDPICFNCLQHLY